MVLKLCRSHLRLCVSVCELWVTGSWTEMWRPEINQLMPYLLFEWFHSIKINNNCGAFMAFAVAFVCTLAAFPDEKKGQNKIHYWWWIHLGRKKNYYLKFIKCFIPFYAVDRWFRNLRALNYGTLQIVP